MIVRVFRVRTHPGRETEFRQFMLDIGRPGLFKREGCVGAFIGQRTWGDQPESLVISRWASREALEAFAGEHWESGHINDKAAHLIAEVFCDNYEEIE
jgi:quinol monooxygenase YgiN